MVWGQCLAVILEILTMLFAVVSLELYSHWHGPVDPGNVRQLYNGQQAVLAL